MRTLGATLETVESGTVTITCRFNEGLTQQHGLLHGGVMASLVDAACGYAALSVMPADREVLTVEFKINFIDPANTDRLIAVGQVLKAGRTLTVCEGSVFDATRTRSLLDGRRDDDGGAGDGALAATPRRCDCGDQIDEVMIARAEGAAERLNARNVIAGDDARRLVPWLRFESEITLCCKSYKTKVKVCGWKAGIRTAHSVD